MEHDFIVINSNDVISQEGMGSLSVSALYDAFAELSKQQLQVTKFLINKADYEDLEKWATG